MRGPMAQRNVSLDGPRLLRQLMVQRNVLLDGSPLSRGRQLPVYQRRRITAASSHAIARYITDENTASKVIAVITMFILKIWLPYWIR
jgi:hypothetical protein